MKVYLFIFFWLLSATICFAQPSPASRWVSEKGYWQIVSNIKTPKSNTVYFYTNHGDLVYSEKIEDIKINLKKKKTLLKLKEVLEQTVIAWQRQQLVKNDMLLLVTLKKRTIKE